MVAEDAVKSSARPGGGRRRAERRLPMALAVVVAGVLYRLIPSAFRVSVAFQVTYWTVLVLLLAVLIVGDPGRIDKARRWLRLTTGAMIALVTVWSLGAVARLVVGILQKAVFTTPTDLLTAGAVTWITNIIAFALWYWYLDGGGAVARAADQLTSRPAFRFREQDLPELVDDGWYPQFVDYLTLSFNISTAFGAADVSPIRHWSKLSTMGEAAISLTLVALVVARAVNVL
jgi:uncharacterized membrane protein